MPRWAGLALCDASTNRIALGGGKEFQGFKMIA